MLRISAGNTGRNRSKGVDFHAELMEWMPPPDGIAMCQSDVDLM